MKLKSNLLIWVFILFVIEQLVIVVVRNLVRVRINYDLRCMKICSFGF